MGATWILGGEEGRRCAGECCSRPSWKLPVVPTIPTRSISRPLPTDQVARASSADRGAGSVSAYRDGRGSEGACPTGSTAARGRFCVPAITTRTGSASSASRRVSHYTAWSALRQIAAPSFPIQRSSTPSSRTRKRAPVRVRDTARIMSASSPPLRVVSFSGGSSHSRTSCVARRTPRE